MSRRGGSEPDEIAGSITDPSQVERATGDAGAVVIVVESSGSPGPDGPEAVHVGGVQNVIAATSPETHIVLITQIYITRPDAFEQMRDVIVARGRGEEALRRSGRPYTIVRPSWLTDDPSGQAIRFEQGDSGDGEIARVDVAAVVVAALGSPRARGKTVEIYNEDGPSAIDWDAAFAALSAD
jgi:uncharacterized protein YbjT (DUF2867 family)